jgi:hypothetical protein
MQKTVTGQEALEAEASDEASATEEVTQPPSDQPIPFNVMFNNISEEIKSNTGLEMSMKERLNIATRICKLHINKQIPLEEAKRLMYEKHNITINYPTRDFTVVDEDNFGRILENNELIGKFVYGWDSNGNAVYEPTLGVSIVSPKYKNAGNEWRQMLDVRYSKIDPSERECALEDYTGN